MGQSISLKKIESVEKEKKKKKVNNAARAIFYPVAGMVLDHVLDMPLPLFTVAGFTIGAYYAAKTLIPSDI